MGFCDGFLYSAAVPLTIGKSCKLGSSFYFFFEGATSSNTQGLLLLALYLGIS